LPVKALTLSLLLLSAPAWGGPKIHKDKVYHFVAGFSITAVTNALIPDQPFLGLELGIGAGILKELLWDLLLNRGDPDIWDAAATALGSGLSFSLTVKF
jgi:hypothetical protein